VTGVVDALFGVVLAIIVNTHNFIKLCHELLRVRIEILFQLSLGA